MKKAVRAQINGERNLFHQIYYEPDLVAYKLLVHIIKHEYI